MSNSDNFSQFFSKKAYELSYAAFRIGSVVQLQGFVESLLGQSFSLLDLAVRGRYSECRNIAESMEYLLRLGGDAGIVHPRNVETMVQEIGQFNSAIAEYERMKSQPVAVSLEGSFSGMPASREKTEGLAKLIFAQAPVNEKINRDFPNGDIQQTRKENISPDKPITRQSAILEIIRQSGNCRLKDVQDYFKEVSERTIRYDLQDLIERGLLLRIGNGGPSTYYKVNQVVEDKIAR